MWLAGTPVHDVYIGTRAVAVCRGAQALLSQPVEDIDAAVAALSAWLAQTQARHRIRLWLSGGLCRPFVLPSVTGLRGAVELRCMASAVAAQHTALEGPCRVWVDEAKRGSRVAVAVQESLLQRLLDILNLETARGAKPYLVSIRPWWADVLRAALGREPTQRAVAAQDCDSLTVFIGDGDDGDAVSVATTLTPMIDVESADSALARMLLSADVEQGDHVLARLSLHRDRDVNMPDLDVALSPLVEFA